MLKNLKLATKLSGAFLIVLALMAGMGMFAVTRLTIVNGAAVDLATSWMPSVRTALSMKASLNRVRVLEFKAIMSENADDIARMDKEMTDKLAELQRNQLDYEKLVTSPEERALFENVKSEFAAYAAEHLRLSALTLQNKDDQAKALLLGESLRHYDALRILCDKLSDLNIAGGDRAAKDAEATYSSARVGIIASIGGCALLAMAMALVITRGITVPVRAAVDAANRLADGDLTVRIAVEGKDEIAQLSDALTVMTQSIADREVALTEMIGALEVARNEAVKANDAKSQFLANMSHELRTPLNAIVGFGEMLHQEILGPLGVARYREYAGDILSSGRRLLVLVSRMLDLAEVETGKFVIERKTLSAASALHQAVVAIRPIADKAGVRLLFESDNETSQVEGDAAKLLQAFTSILHNAVKFTPSGSDVCASLKVEPTGIAIRIADSGVGMSEADLEVVTRPFHRLRSALDGQHQGAGLGLPLAKAIIELHGGVLSIMSTSGSGTTVDIRLPAAGLRMSDAA